MIVYVDENDENKRLDSFLTEITPDLSRSKIQNLIKSGSIKINNIGWLFNCIINFLKFRI